MQKHSAGELTVNVSHPTPDPAQVWALSESSRELEAGESTGRFRATRREADLVVVHSDVQIGRCDADIGVPDGVADLR